MIISDEASTIVDVLSMAIAGFFWLDKVSRIVYLNGKRVEEVIIFFMIDLKNQME